MTLAENGWKGYPKDDKIHNLQMNYNGQHFTIYPFGSAFVLTIRGDVMDWDNDLSVLLSRFVV